MDTVETFVACVDQTGRIVAAVEPGQLKDPTPCADWDVRALLNHTVAVIQAFDEAARGVPFNFGRFSEDLIGDDHAGAYESAARSLRETMKAKDVLDRTWTMPFGEVPGAIGAAFSTVEVHQHGWDVAKATGQQFAFDPELAEAAMATAQLMPAEQVRQPGVFANAVDCAPSLPVHDRLAAFLGRQL